MGWRFHRSIKILPGVRWNFSKSGTSWSFGPRGYKINVGPRGVRKTISLPGTGLSYTEQVSSKRRGIQAGRSLPSAALTISPPPVWARADPARFGTKWHPLRRVAVAHVGCCSLAAIGVVVLGHPEIVGLPILGALVGVGTALALPDASRMAGRELHRRLWLFHLEALTVKPGQDDIAHLRQTQTDLGLTDAEASPDMSAIYGLEQQRELRAFITRFKGDFIPGDKERLKALERAAEQVTYPSPEIERRHQVVTAALRALELQQQIADSGGCLPTIPDTLGLAGRDTLHFRALAFMDRHGPNDEHGELLLTDKRLLFNATSLASCTWHQVTTIRRESATVSVSRQDRQTAWLFSFKNIAEATCAELLAKRLAGNSAPFEFVIPHGFLDDGPALASPHLRQDLPEYHSHSWSDRIVVGGGLGLASLVLFPLALGAPAPTQRRLVPVAEAQVSELPVSPYQILGAASGTLFLLVSEETARDDARLTAIGRVQQRARGDMPLEVMFWTDAKQPPTRLPLTRAQQRTRVAVIHLRNGVELLERRPTRPPSKAPR